MDIYASNNLDIREKSDKSPVTMADIAAHNYIVSHLQKTCPFLSIVSEEGDDSRKYVSEKDQFWLIDPLDGTKEFLSGSDEFTINIALIDKSRSVFGIVYVPALSILYWGGPKIGAYRVSDDIEMAIQVARKKPHSIKKVEVSKNHLDDATKSFIQYLGKIELSYSGSSLKFCRVAEGSADIYPRFAATCEWDTAAAQAILEGAGGVVLDLNGESLIYGKSNVLNPSFIAASSKSLTESFGF